jgi:site-specific DNA-cytosine methylase
MSIFKRNKHDRTHQIMQFNTPNKNKRIFIIGCDNKDKTLKECIIDAVSGPDKFIAVTRKKKCKILCGNIEHARKHCNQLNALDHSCMHPVKDSCRHQYSEIDEMYDDIERGIYSNDRTSSYPEFSHDFNIPPVKQIEHQHIIFSCEIYFDRHNNLWIGKINGRVHCGFRSLNKVKRYIAKKMAGVKV